MDDRSFHGGPGLGGNTASRLQLGDTFFQFIDARQKRLDNIRLAWSRILGAERQWSG